MRNLGPKSTAWLAAVGIHTIDDLRQVGVITAYNLVKAHGYNATLNLLWAMQGAVTDVQSLNVPESIKQQLQQRLKESA